MDIRLSDAEKVFLISGVEEGVRNDGRSCEEYRPIFLERGVLSTTDGSARVRIDKTDILVGVKCELQNVEDTSKVPNKIRFSVDCSANASPQFEGKGGDLYADDIASGLEAAYNNDYVLPSLNKLVLSPNHLWVIYVDVVILQYGGSVVDAASIGIKAALSDLQIAEVNMRRGDAKRFIVELPDDEKTWSLDISNLPLIVSVNKIGTGNVVDCTEMEEVCIRSALWVGVCKTKTAEDAIVSLVRQSSGGSLERLSIEEMLALAIKVAQQLHTSVDSRLLEEDQQEEAPPPAVVASHTGHVGYENKELNVHVGKLWCGVQNVGEDITVAYGHFVRARDGKQFEGRIEGKHVLLDVGKAPSTVAGKYKCEVRTDYGDLLSGNLFIYMAPVLHFPAGVNGATEVPQTRPPRVLGTKVVLSEGDLLQLKCPVFGYPEPFVHWEKDGKPIDRAEYHDNDISISSATASDSGVYKCTADNSFPVFVGGPSIAHQLIYEQTVVVD